MKVWGVIRARLRDARPWALMALFVAGFGYVAIVLSGRGNPFQSGNPGYWDIAFVALSAPVFFLLAGRQTLKPLGSPPGLMLLRNGLLFALPFFAALHWEFIGNFFGASFSLNPRSLARMSAPDIIAAIIALVFIGLSVAWHVRQARREQILGWYAGAFVGIIVIIAVVTLVLRETHYIHIHHYTIGGLFALFWRFNHPISAMYQGFFLGMFVEGIARWGRDPNWIPYG